MRTVLFFFFCVLVYTGASNKLFAQKTGQARIDSLRGELSLANGDFVKENIYGLLSDAFLSNNSDSSLYYANQKLHLAEKMACDTCKWGAYIKQSQAYIYIGDYKEAIAAIMNVVKIADASTDKRWIGNAYILYAGICHLQGKYADAIDYYYRSLKIAEKLDYRLATTKNLFSFAYVGIGNASMLQHNEPEALRNYFSGLKIDSEQNNKLGMAGAYNNIGNIYADQHKYLEALDYYNRALKANKAILNAQWQVINYSNIGFVHRDLENYPEALLNFNEAIKIGEEIKDKTDIAQGLTGAGSIYIKLQNYRMARTLLNRAVALSKETGNTENLRDGYQQLAILDSAIGDWKSAYENRKQYIIFRDSVANQDNAQKLTQNRMQYEFDKKEAIAKEDAKQQRTIRNTSFAGIGVLLLSTLVVARQRNKVRQEKKRSDDLLLNILPAETAEELKATGSTKAKYHSDVTVMFTDFKNFSSLSKQMNAQELVNEINYCYSAFDHIIGKYGLEKIKTIGDSYMCAGGLPVANKTHATDVVTAALEIRDFMIEEQRKREAEGRIFFEIKIGIHTGPVVAGIVGIKKFAYDIWGDTVNLASRMESADEAGKINISETTYELVKDKFDCTHRGKIAAKNMGEIDMYFVARML